MRCEFCDTEATKTIVQQVNTTLPGDEYTNFKPGTVIKLCDQHYHEMTEMFRIRGDIARKKIMPRNAKLVDNKWVEAKPLPAPLFRRLKNAWLVIKGDAEIHTYPPQNEADT